MLQAQPQDRITVYVVAEQDASGFVATGVPDSLKDIQNEIPKRRQLRLVASSERADVVLRVVERRKVSAGGGVFAMPLGVSTVALPIETEANVVSTLLEVGERREPLVVQVSGTGGVWKECAEQVSKQLAAWVGSNRAALVARRR